MRPQSLLLVAENIPHFINRATRTRVLSAYRELQRNIGRLADPFARAYLRQLAQHTFSGYKFVADTYKINALLDYAETHEFKWAALAAESRVKGLDKVIEIAYTTYGVKESPLKRVMAQPPRTCDHKSLWYRLNNIPEPQISTFAEHSEMMQRTQDRNASLEPYWELVRILHKSGVRFGRHRRILHYHINETTSTVNDFGKPLALRRQRNVLKRAFTKFLRDAPRPIHPQCFEDISQLGSSPALPRLYRNRFKQLARQVYTCDEFGRPKFVNIYA